MVRTVLLLRHVSSRMTAQFVEYCDRIGSTSEWGGQPDKCCTRRQHGSSHLLHRSWPCPSTSVSQSTSCKPTDSLSAWATTSSKMPDLCASRTTAISMRQASTTTVCMRYSEVGISCIEYMQRKWCAARPPRSARPPLNRRCHVRPRPNSAEPSSRALRLPA
jgi:hypothetical protein